MTLREIVDKNIKNLDDQKANDIVNHINILEKEEIFTLDSLIDYLRKNLINNKLLESAYWLFANSNDKNAFNYIVSRLNSVNINNDEISLICWALGRLRFNQSTEILLKIIGESSSKNIIWEAAHSLTCLESKNSIKPLIDIIINGKNLERRKAAAYSLGHLGDKNSAEILTKVLLDKKEKSSLRAEIAEALGVIGNKIAFEPLVKSIRDNSVEVRFWSIYSLGQLGEKKAIPILQEIAESDQGILKGWGSIKDEAIDSINQINTLSID